MDNQVENCKHESIISITGGMPIKEYAQACDCCGVEIAHKKGLRLGVKGLNSSQKT